MTGTVLVLGATSAIARATAAAMARRGRDLFLAARDLEEIERQAADLRIRYGVKVGFGAFDVEAPERHGGFLDGVTAQMGPLEGVVLAVGYLGDQTAARRFDAGAKVIATNFTGPVSILSHCAERMEAAGRGFIVGISSVAGDRGRQSNYVYGAAKGGLTVFLQGLRNRLAPRGVHVLTVKPGFVDTAMTFGMPGLFLVASPEHVGERIARAAEAGRDVIYVPWFWRYIMLLICMIPERVFKRLKL